MRDLANQVGIGDDPAFLNGNLVNNQTLVGEGINQDLVQFFQKLADLAGTVFNDLPDNETNGYQLMEALELVVRAFAATTALKGTVEKATPTETSNGTPNKFIDAELLKNELNSEGSFQTLTVSGAPVVEQTVKVRKDRQGKIELRGRLSGGFGSVIDCFRLPVGLRPTYIQAITVATWGTTTGQQYIPSILTIKTDGYVSIFKNPALTDIDTLFMCNVFSYDIP